MAKKILTNLDMNLNEIQNVKAQIVATDPATGTAGQFIYNSTDKLFKYHNGTGWAAIGEGIQSIAPQTGETVLSVVATDPNNPKLVFNISATQGEGVTVEEKNDGVKVSVQDGTTVQKGIVQLDSTPSATEETKAATPKGANVTLTEQATAESGYLKTYVINQGGSEVGKINIPFDFLVKSATTGTVETADKQPGGKFADETKYADFLVGDHYIDLVINAKEGTATEDHVYILTKNMGNFTSRMSGYLAIGDTSATITTPKNSLIVSAWMTDSAGNELLCDIQKTEATSSATGSVVFSISEAQTENLSCYVSYFKKAS